MRKPVIAFGAVCVVAAGAAWYAFSYLPGQIRAEIDASIASLAPKVLVTYGDVDIDIFDRQAVFTDVTAQAETGGMFGDAKRMTVSVAGGQDEFDVLLENPSFTASKTPGDKFLASTVQLEGLSIGPDSDSAGSAELAFLKRLNLRKLSIRKIVDVHKKLRISDAVLEGLSEGRFSKAEITAIHGKDPGKQVEFSFARISAGKIDVVQIATLPTTFRGQPDLSKLSTGKIAVERARAKIQDTSMSIAETLSEGISAGRIVRFQMTDAQIKGSSKDGKPFSVGLEKLEVNNAPIILRFPTDLEELRSFQTQHKNLIYDGFDIRNLKIAGVDGSFEIHNAKIPKPVFRKTPSGIQYAAKSEITMDIRGDFGALKKSRKALNPMVGKIFKDLKGRIILSGQGHADHEKKTGAIEAMELTVPGVARLKLSGAIGNLPLRYYEAPNDPIVQQIALRQATLGALDLTLVNEGLAEKLLELGASQNNVSTEDFANRLAIMVRAAVGADGSAEGLAIAGEIGKFLRDPRTIRLTLKPTRTLPVMALGNPQLLQSVGQVSKVLGLKLEANGADK